LSHTVIKLSEHDQQDYEMNTMEVDKITHSIIGCAMKVHNTLGNGFQEVIYQRAMAIEMEKQGLGFTREMEMPIFYEEINIGTRRVDFFVQDAVMVELKAIEKLEQGAQSTSHQLLRSV